MVNFKTREGKPKSGDNRLYKILIAESAMLIWSLRNQRVCNDLDKDAWAYERRSENKMDLEDKRKTYLRSYFDSQEIRTPRD